MKRTVQRGCKWHKKVFQTRIKRERKHREKVYARRPWRISLEALEMLDRAMEELHNGYEPRIFDFKNW